MEKLYKKVARHFGLVLCLLMFLVMTGCASIVKGGPGSVAIKSTPSDAKITIYDARSGEAITSGNTPYTAVLKRGAGYFKGGKYKVVVEKAGYASKEVMIGTVLNGWYVGNLVFGGAIGLLIVDPLTGAMWYLDPEDINFDLEKKETALPPEGGLVVMLKERFDELSKHVTPTMQPIVMSAAR